MTQTDNPVQKLAAVECGDCLHPGSSIRLPKFCDTCYGAGKRYWQLWRACPCSCHTPGPYSLVHPESEPCQCHIGYVLRPEAEWLGILYRIKHQFEKDGKGIILNFKWARSDKPEAALAEAIWEAECQSRN